MDFADDAFLGVGEGEGQVMAVETVEDGTYVLEHIAAVFASLVAGIPEDVELHVKKFLKLQPHFGLVEFGGAVGVVDHPEGVVAGNEMERPRDVGGQCLSQCAAHSFE